MGLTKMTFQNTVLSAVYVSIMAAGFIFLSSPFDYLKDSKAAQQINNHFMEMEAVAMGIEMPNKIEAS